MYGHAWEVSFPLTTSFRKLLMMARDDGLKTLTPGSYFEVRMSTELSKPVDGSRLWVNWVSLREMAGIMPNEFEDFTYDTGSFGIGQRTVGRYKVIDHG